jgi:hypothetical protein
VRDTTRDSSLPEDLQEAWDNGVEVDAPRSGRTSKRRRASSTAELTTAYDLTRARPGSGIRWRGGSRLLDLREQLVDEVEHEFAARARATARFPGAIYP